MARLMQQEALLNYFLAVIQENGYYTELRKVFIKDKGYNYADMASMLLNEYDDAPDGISVYWYMDSLEDVLCEMDKKSQKELHDIADLVETVYDKMAWKE